MTSSTRVPQTVLGEGAYGIVWEHAGNAIKSIQEPPQYGIPSSAIRECDVYVRLSHRFPYFLECYDIRMPETKQSKVRIVMQKANKSLYDASRHFTMKEKLYSFQYIAWYLIQAIEMMHTNGLIHRDIKPSNCLMISDNPVDGVAIVDFGTAVPIKGRCKGGSTTPCVEAPECSRYCYSEKSDAYSIGATLLHFLMASDHEDNTHQKRLNSIEYSQKIPENTKQFLLSLMSTNPDTRISLQQALKWKGFFTHHFPMPPPVRTPVLSESMLAIDRSHHNLLTWFITHCKRHRFEKSTIMHTVLLFHKVLLLSLENVEYQTILLAVCWMVLKYREFDALIKSELIQQWFDVSGNVRDLCKWERFLWKSLNYSVHVEIPDEFYFMTYEQLIDYVSPEEGP